MIVELPPPAVSTIVPPFNETAFVPILSMSPADVAALPAAIARVNISSLLVEPLAYDNVWFALWSLTTVNCGVPDTVTFSLKNTLTDSVPPSDLSNAVVTKSISVMSACPIPTARSAPVATRISSRFLEPTVFFRTQPSGFAIQFFSSAVFKYFGFDSSVADTPHYAI